MKKKIDPIVQGATLSSLLTVAACREWGCGFHFVFPLLLRFFLTPSLSYNQINMLEGFFSRCLLCAHCVAPRLHGTLQDILNIDNELVLWSPHKLEKEERKNKEKEKTIRNERLNVIVCFEALKKVLILYLFEGLTL